MAFYFDSGEGAMVAAVFRFGVMSDEVVATVGTGDRSVCPK